MNAAVTKPAFAHLLPADSFQAWRVLSDGTSQPLDIIAGDLAEAIQSASVKCQHKDYFTILHIAPSGKRTEHVCYVKQGKQQWVRKPGYAHAVSIRPLSAEVLFSRAVVAVAPVELWRWSLGADVVGRQVGEVL